MALQRMGEHSTLNAYGGRQVAPQYLTIHPPNNIEEIHLRNKLLKFLPPFALMVRMSGASLVAQTVKNLPAMQEIQIQFLGREDFLKKGMATHSSILRGEFYRQRTLVSHSPWGHRELDMTKWLILSLLQSINKAKVSLRVRTWLKMTSIPN